MKAFLRSVPVICFVFFFCANALGASAPKIGTVDIQKFQKESKAFQKISAELKQKYEAMKKQLEEERAALQKLEEDGVASFEKSFDGLYKNLDEKKGQFLGTPVPTS